MTVTQIMEIMPQEVPEGGECEVTFQVVDGGQNPVPVASLITLRLWLFDQSVGTIASGPYINSRSAQNVKNANGCTLVEAGGITTATLKLAGADHPIVTTGKRSELHIAYFDWTWVGGVGPGKKKLGIRVLAMP